MDSELWISRLAAAKRNYSNQRQQSSQTDRFEVDEYEVEEDVRLDFPCPFCYEDHDIASLCSHLEDEHPFESKVAVCPICSVKVARNVLSHITSQHGQLYKLQRRRRLRRVAIPNSQTLSLLGRELREAHLQVLLGSGAYRSSNNNTSTTTADCFLSSLALNIPPSQVEESSKSPFSNAEDFVSRKPTRPHSRRSSPACISEQSSGRQLSNNRSTPKLTTPYSRSEHFKLPDFGCRITSNYPISGVESLPGVIQYNGPFIGINIPYV